MRTETTNTIKALLFQGDTTGNALPPALIETLRYYEDAARSCWMVDITPREVLAFIVNAVEAHREDLRYEVGQEMHVPSREQTVWFVRHAPWGCIMVKDVSGTMFLIQESRVRTISPETATEMEQELTSSLTSTMAPKKKKMQPA
jgi:hypothetical protein